MRPAAGTKRKTLHCSDSTAGRTGLKEEDRQFHEGPLGDFTFCRVSRRFRELKEKKSELPVG